MRTSAARSPIHCRPKFQAGFQKGQLPHTAINRQHHTLQQRKQRRHGTSAVNELKCRQARWVVRRRERLRNEPPTLTIGKLCRWRELVVSTFSLPVLPSVRQRSPARVIKNTKISACAASLGRRTLPKLTPCGSASAARKVYPTVAVNGSLKITSAFSRVVFRATDITVVAC
jgi:hypothetical protein